MSAAISILLLHGDAEARLLADAEAAIQSMFVEREVRLVKQWATRPDCLAPSSPAPAGSLQTFAAVPGTDVRALLGQQHSLIIFSLLPATTLPALRNAAGHVFLAHSGLRASWSADVAARVAAEYTEQSPLSPAAAAMALEPEIERLLANGSAVAVCTTFRHVKTPLEHRGSSDVAGLREVIRRTNLEVFRLSRRTGCFVLDFDRPLAQEGGASVNADCFGGDGRAAEIAVDEFAALVLDAIPDSLTSSEVS